MSLIKINNQSKINTNLTAFERNLSYSFECLTLRMFKCFECLNLRSLILTITVGYRLQPFFFAITIFIFNYVANRMLKFLVVFWK